MARTVILLDPADLKVFRVEMALTQAQLASKLGAGWSALAIANMERGITRIPERMHADLEALRAKLKPAVAEPAKPSLAERRKEADFRHEIELRRENYAKRGYASLEDYLEKRANEQPIRGHVTPSDCRYQREVLDFARANNLLK